MNLMNPEAAKAMLEGDKWAWSHGARGQFLGCGLLYYAIGYVLASRLNVCLGSGSGFVPKFMRQAQRDLGIAEKSRTILVDACVGKGGRADYYDGPTVFTEQYPDIDLVKQTTLSYVTSCPRPIGFLHIDADHSFEGCIRDFDAYWPLVDSGGIVTLHDASWPDAGVAQAVARIRGSFGVAVLSIGTGLAIVGKPGPIVKKP